ncbi:entericidin A/B family lipoprotein [Crenobacter caeni]|uniref:Entericidin A/B family lipoprotein n=1 Tax=Crenobacter caeni TaxID=2705474 RepID=A0A6B2KSN6_9NEIS|nr:entericidin A/B family lipoprotein [Crenobacter caeni]NDV13093.1 entericidin A/B family lipoprotein [Crenobacter caeni]
MMRLGSLFILFASVLSAGCNTVQGMGQDIQKGGQVVSNAARDVANKF